MRYIRSAPAMTMTEEMLISMFLSASRYMMSSVAATPMPREGMNRVPPRRGMDCLWTLRALGSS